MSKWITLKMTRHIISTQLEPVPVTQLRCPSHGLEPPVVCVPLQQ